MHGLVPFTLTFQLLCYQSQNGKVLITLHGGTSTNTCLHETHKQTHRRVTLTNEAGQTDVYCNVDESDRSIVDEKK